MDDGTEFLRVPQCFSGREIPRQFAFPYNFKPAWEINVSTESFVVEATRVVELFWNYVTQREVEMELTQGFRSRRLPSYQG